MGSISQKQLLGTRWFPLFVRIHTCSPGSEAILNYRSCPITLTLNGFYYKNRSTTVSVNADRIALRAGYSYNA